ncbi:tribbles 1-like [Arapaima gigas]
MSARCGDKRRVKPVSESAVLSETPAETAYLTHAPAVPARLASSRGSPSPQGLSRICHFLLVPMAGRCGTHSALHVVTGDEFVCKVFNMSHYQEKMRTHGILPAHRNIAQIKDIILGDQKAYVFFDKDFGDMHTFVKSCRKLSEERASRLFHQVVSAVAHCHQASIVLGDLKLRKFVFSDEKRTHLRLESLEDAHILEGDSDSMSDKHGCPAYVSPEILSRSGSYSGRCADMWSLGVILYTLLVGRYPFHDPDPGVLFSKIRRGQYCLPESLSPGARCLLRSLLRRDPLERLTATEVLMHPWFRDAQEAGRMEQETNVADQTVPTFSPEPDELPFC